MDQTHGGRGLDDMTDSIHYYKMLGAGGNVAFMFWKAMSRFFASALIESV